MKIFGALVGALLALQAATAFHVEDLFRPGQCPVQTTPPECPMDKQVECIFDMDCKGEQKCCTVGCNVLCVNSDGSIPTQKIDRQGCPKVDPFSACENSHAQCLSDQHCVGGDKCCFEGCTFKCLGEPIPSKPACTAQVELGILIDTSGSLTHKDFNLEMKFVQNLISHFTVSPTAARISIGTISSTPEIILSLDQGTDDIMVLSALEFISFEQGGSELDLALHAAADSMFTSAREGVVKALVVLSDGKSTTEPTGFELAIVGLDTQDVLVYSVGVSSDINVFSLYQMATDESHIFAGDEYGKMMEAEQEISRMICSHAEGNMHI